MPELEVEHRPRASLRGWARQRFDYGSSAARLDQRHRGAAAPLRIDRASASVWLAAVVLGPRGGLATALGQTAVSASRRRDRTASATVARLSLRRHLATGRQVARATARDWLPATAIAALLSERARRAALVAIAVDATASTMRWPRLALPGNVLLRGT